MIRWRFVSSVLLTAACLVYAGCANALVMTSAAPAPARVDEMRGLPNFGAVSEGLYRGAQPTAEGFQILEARGIRTVISLRDWHDDAPLLAGTQLKYVHLPCSPLGVREADVIAFLKVVKAPENQPVFVHCEFGADRTGMMVGAYRVVMLGWSNEAAAKELASYGFHEVFGPIRRYVEKMEGERLRRGMGITAGQV